MVGACFVYLYMETNNENTTTIQDLTIENPINIELIDDVLPAYPIGQEIDILKDNIEGIVVTSSDENIVKIVNNKAITISKGTVLLTASNGEINKSIEVNVTDLYTLPDASEDKPFLKDTICDSTQAKILDEVLKKQIDDAGYKTRAGVVAAARFLSLQFPYKIAYFSESGRMDDTIGTTICDGEGRYYHEGLYLSSDKYDLIEKSIYGPKYWGEFFHEDDTDDHSKDDFYLYDGFVPADIGSHLYLCKRPNGLDCSGFVSWCYLNGGFDFGDMGAGGPDVYGMSDLGELVYINDELLQSDRIKAGDLVGLSAHVGIVVGVDEKSIWIADTLISGLKVKKYERNEKSFKELGKDSWQYFMLMDNEYIEDGNYTPMWN